MATAALFAERRRAEARQDLLIAELDHRVKNVLARVAVIAMQTRQNSMTMDEFVQALDGRIQSMAAAYSLLSQSRWGAVGLTDLKTTGYSGSTSLCSSSISCPNTAKNSTATCGPHRQIVATDYSECLQSMSS